MVERSRRSERPPGPDAHAAALGHAIKVLRTDQGMDRAELAEASGLSYPYLSEIENGKKRPSSRALESLAEALGLRAHELLAAADSRVEMVEGAEVDAAYLMAEAPAPGSPRRRSWFRDEPMRVASLRASAPGHTADLARELGELLTRLTAEDADRVLDLARRLAR
ncbi:MAG: helix-turn-helix transcriptional regulator [Actinomycetota bacterium]